MEVGLSETGLLTIEFSGPNDTIGIRIQHNELFVPTEYTFSYKREGEEPIEHIEEGDPAYQYLFDVSPWTEGSDFASSFFSSCLTSPLEPQKMFQCALSTLVGTMLCLHTLFPDDSFAEQTGHEYVLDPITLEEISQQRIQKATPFFQMMYQTFDGTAEEVFGRAGYQLALELHACFTENYDSTYAGYGLASSSILYQETRAMIERDKRERNEQVERLSARIDRLEDRMREVAVGMERSLSISQEIRETLQQLK